MKMNNVCPNCSKPVIFKKPVLFLKDFFEYQEGKAIESLICPHCKTKLVICYIIEPSFYIRKATEKELKELEI